jgi:hypothetical protein
MSGAFFGLLSTALALAVRRRWAQGRVRGLVEELREGHRKLWLVLSDTKGKHLNEKSVKSYLKKRKLADPLRTDLLYEELESLLFWARGYVRNTLEVKDSKIQGAGQGLFVTRNVKEGEFLCVYRGTKLSLAQVMKMSVSDRDYVMGGFGLNVHVDASKHKNVLARYINDNFDKSKLNARFAKIERDACAIVYTTRRLETGEEIYVGYGESYWRARRS